MQKEREKEKEKIMDKRKFWENFKQTLKNMGTATGKILNNLDKADKELQEKMRKSTGGIE